MEPKIDSLNKEIKRSEIEIEVLESTAFSTEKEEEECHQTLGKSDAEKEVEVEERVANKRAMLMGATIKEKWVSMKRDFQDQLRRYGCNRKLEMETIRAYEVWPGKNVFFFHGRLICGPNPRASTLTLVSVVLSSWIFARYVVQDLANHSTFVVTFSLMLTLIVLLNLVLLSAIDPGIIPRNYEECSEPEDIGARDRRRRRNYKKVIINGVEVKLKYCRVCKNFRPPRSCHCAICDSCVERFDHHCPWIGQCIAMRNHRFYLTFVMLAFVFFAYIFAFSCVRMHQRMSNHGAGFIGLVKTCPETLALAAFSCTAMGFSGALFIYHVYLITINETAYENFRQRYVGTKNPFDKGILGNLKEALFVPLPPSRVDFRATVITAATP